MVGALIEDAALRLSSSSQSARLDAELLLQKVTGWSRTEILAHPETSVSPSLVVQFELLVGRRAASEPIAYLLGEREFYGRNFHVDRRALIPRPETELLVDLGRAAVSRFRAVGVAPRVIDLGTGCGAVAVSVAMEARIRVVATDVSLPALQLARENATAFGAEVKFVQADLLHGIRGPLHVILANLPYVPSGRSLPRDVADYEPAIALFGGERGTELIERLLHEVRPLLAPEGEVCVELDEEEQAMPVASLARTLYPSAAVDVRRDGGGYDRVVRVSL